MPTALILVGAIILCLMAPLGCDYSGGDLASAIRANDVKKAKKLLDRNPSLVNQQCDSQWKPLSFALNYNSKPEIVELLLSKGATVNYTEQYSGYTPLIRAIVFSTDGPPGQSYRLNDAAKLLLK